MGLVTVAIDSQMLDTYQLCEEKFNLSFVKLVAPMSKADALEKGSMIHEMLKTYYTLWSIGTSFNERVSRAIEAGILKSATWVDDEMRESMIKTFRSYCEYYQNDTWIVKAVEKPFSKILYESEEEELRILYEGIIDLQVEVPKLETDCVVDHKTMARRTPANFMSNQFKGYAWATGASRVIINKIGLQKTLSIPERMTREPLFYPESIIEEWKRDTIEWVRQMLSSYGRDVWKKNATSCDKFGGCWLRDICMSEPKIRGFKIMRDFKEGREWNPAGSLK